MSLFCPFCRSRPSPERFLPSFEVFGCGTFSSGGGRPAQSRECKLETLRLRVAELEKENSALRGQLVAVCGSYDDCDSVDD